MDSDVEAGAVERLEHDFGGVFAILRRIERLKRMVRNVCDQKLSYSQVP